MLNAETFRAVLTVVGKFSENTSSKTYNFSTTHNLRLQCGLYKELHEPRRAEAASL